MAAPPLIPIAKSPAAPKPPQAGGHYVKVGGNWQLIHAVGPGRWAPGPVGARAQPPVQHGHGGIAGSPLANPNQTLSGPSLVAAAHALANAQTQGPLQELASQIAQNNSQNTGALNQVGGYFNQLGALGQQGVQDEQGIASGLNAQLAQIAQNEQGQLGQIGQNATANLSKYTPQSDQSTTNPGLAGLSAEIARQQGLAAQQQGALGSFGATQGANYSGLSAANLGSLGLRGQEDLTNIAQAGQVKNEPLMAKVADIQATTGADFATALGRLRQQEITNNIAEQGLGIKQADINATVANNIRSNQTSLANNALTNQTSSANNQRTTSTSRANNAANNNPNAVGSPAWARVQNAQGTAWSSNPNAVGSPAWARVQAANARSGRGGSKPLTPNENNAYFRALGQVEQLVQDGQKNGLSQAQIKANLQDGANPAKKSFDPVMVEATYELLGWGHITPQTAAALHNMGVRGGTFRGKPIQVAPPPAAPGPVGGNAIPNIGNAIGNAIGNVGG